jgi:pilus assembly protein Flp/PilA
LRHPPFHLLDGEDWVHQALTGPPGTRTTFWLNALGGSMQDIVRYYVNLLALKTGKGQGLVEYALIIVLISIVAIAIMTSLGASITSVFTNANSALIAPAP